MLEMKCILSVLVRNFEILPTIPAHKLELVSESILKSKSGVRVHLNKRERYS